MPTWRVSLPDLRTFDRSRRPDLRWRGPVRCEKCVWSLCVSRRVTPGNDCRCCTFGARGGMRGGTSVATTASGTAAVGLSPFASGRSSARVARGGGGPFLWSTGTAGRGEAPVPQVQESSGRPGMLPPTTRRARRELDILDRVTDNAHLLAGIDTTRPHTARIWNYWTGGKDNYEVDREAGDQIRKLHPGIGDYALADRLFLGRAVHHLAAEVGIRQFLDIGTGLPSADNTHEVAQRVAPGGADRVRGQRSARPRARPRPAHQYARGPHRLPRRRSARRRHDPGARRRDARPHPARRADAARRGDLHRGRRGVVRHRPPPHGRAARRQSSRPVHTPSPARRCPMWTPPSRSGTSTARPGSPSAPRSSSPGTSTGSTCWSPGVVSCSRWRPRAADGEEPVEVAMFGGVGRKP